MEKEPGKKTGKGGAREGSGRKAVSGMYTKTMRVPTVMEEEVLCLIDMYSNWLKHGKMEKGMARRTTPEQRMRAIRSIQEFIQNFVWFYTEDCVISIGFIICEIFVRP